MSNQKRYKKHNQKKIIYFQPVYQPILSVSNPNLLMSSSAEMKEDESMILNNQLETSQNISN